MRWRVLVTGFGAFPGAPVNPTLAILRHLERSRSRLARLGIALDVIEIPVCYAGLDTALDHAVASCRPDAVLHLGLAGRRTRISVETRALNRAGPLHPDAARRVPGSQVLSGGAPQVLAATYPAARVLAAIGSKGHRAARSIDAGDYVCNATLYWSLLRSVAPQVGFLHVPRVRRSGQPKGRSPHPRPTVAALADAVLSALIVMSGEPLRRPPARSAGRAGRRASSLPAPSGRRR